MFALTFLDQYFVTKLHCLLICRQHGNPEGAIPILEAISNFRQILDRFSENLHRGLLRYATVVNNTSLLQVSYSKVFCFKSHKVICLSGTQLELSASGEGLQTKKSLRNCALQLKFPNPHATDWSNNNIRIWGLLVLY